MARTAGSWVGVVGTRSSSRSARRPSCARAPLRSTMRRCSSIVVRTGTSAAPVPGSILPDARAGRRLPGAPVAAPTGLRIPPPVTAANRRSGAVAGPQGLVSTGRRWTPARAPRSPEPTARRRHGRRPRSWRPSSTPPPPSTASPAPGCSRSGPTPGPASSARPSRELPRVAGRPVIELAGRALRTGRTGDGHRAARRPTAPPATLVLQPLSVSGEPGVLLVLETGAGRAGGGTGADLVEQAQSALLPPSLPLLPDIRLSGSYDRATSVGAAGGDWYDAVPLGSGPARPRHRRRRGLRGAGRRRDEPAARRDALDRHAGPVAGRGRRPPSTSSPRRWTTSRAPRCSTASSRPAPAGSPTPRPVTRRRWSSRRTAAPPSCRWCRARRWAACRAPAPRSRTPCWSRAPRWSSSPTAR